MGNLKSIIGSGLARNLCQNVFIIFISAELFTHSEVPTLLNWVSASREKTIIFSLRVHPVM